MGRLGLPWVNWSMAETDLFLIYSVFKTLIMADSYIKIIYIFITYILD